MMDTLLEPDEHTERKESCEDYAHDPYVRAECDEGRCKCLRKNGRGES